MYCTNCGAYIQDGAKFCQNCGEKLAPGPEAEQNQQSSQQNTETTFSKPDYSDYVEKNNSEMRPECSQLAWHKFLIYFILIIEAIFDLITAYNFISGAGFGVDKNYITANFPDVVTVVKVNGYLYLALGLYTISTRNSLAKFKSGAPDKLTLMYVFSAFLAFLGNLLISPAFGSESVSFGIIITPVLHALFWILVNKSYYKKRQALFKN